VTTYVGLYYPLIHFKDENWLKLTALYWDRMGRIVPRGFQPRDTDTVRQLEEHGYVLAFRPDEPATLEAKKPFMDLIVHHGAALRERYGWPVRLARERPDQGWCWTRRWTTSSSKLCARQV
jgi:hypothetical protein